MRIEDDIKFDFDDVLIRPKRSSLSSRSEVDLEREYKFKHTNFTYKGVPIVAANMDTIGTFLMNKALHSHNMMTALHKHYTVDELVSHYLAQDSREYWNTWYSMGITDKDFEKLYSFRKGWDKKAIGGTVNMKICLDVANGYQESFVDAIKRIRDEVNDAVIMAGNVVTADMTEALIISGADVVKVGIGPGSVCTTRTKTGVGYPQLSAIIECADAAHGLKGQVCADGGCRVPGDIAKAFGAGADFVMLGGMLSGHKECGGEIFERSDGSKKGRPRKFVKFYGMSSDTAMEKHSGGVAKYRASEGKTVEIPYKGPVENTVQEILGGLRSTCTYAGALKLKELSKRTTFVRVNRQKNNIYGTD